MTDKLSADFINELLRAVMRDTELLDTVIQHLEYKFLPTQEYKEIWKAIKSNYELNNAPPSFGVLSEQYKGKPEVIQQLAQVKRADIVGSDPLRVQFETFIRKAMFVDLHSELKDLWQEGKQDDAFGLLQKQSEKINAFSLQKQNFLDVIGSFEERYRERQTENIMNIGGTLRSKSKWGVDCLDERTYGGVDKGDTALITARSGVGKSKALKHVGMTNARLGKIVLHFQLEGSEKEAKDAYDTMMAGSSLQDIELSTLTEDRLNAVIKASKKVEGKIYVVAPEKFGALTMADIRSQIAEFIKTHDKTPDVIILDYIDKSEPSDGKRYSTNTDGEKARRSALAHNFKDICVEFNMSGFTATQASDVKEDVWNNPNKVLTRSDVKGDKNVIDPYSYHFTLNQTRDEKKNAIIRIHEDKMRKYAGGKTHRICTAYENEKFYNRKRTISLFTDE